MKLKSLCDKQRYIINFIMMQRNTNSFLVEKDLREILFKYPENLR